MRTGRSGRKRRVSHGRLKEKGAIEEEGKLSGRCTTEIKVRCVRGEKIMGVKEHTENSRVTRRGQMGYG